MRSTTLLSRLSILIAAALSAQAPATPPARQVPETAALVWPAVPFVDRAADGSLWAAHAAWKARFTAEGVDFQPFLGSAAPARSARFALRAASVAGEALPLAVATPERQGAVVAYPRGAVLETYTLEAGGIEQQFELKALPVRGALRLEIGVATDLEVVPTPAGHEFRAADGGIRCGQAFAVDAGGRVCALETHWDDGALVTTVPAAFVADATLPLRIDPMISTIQTLNSGTVALTPTDIAFDPGHQLWCVVYERAYSATDHDVFVAELDTAMVPVTTVTIDISSEYWTAPRIAGLAVTGKIAVVAQASTANLPPFQIVGRRFVAGQAPTPEPVVALFTDSVRNYYDPDIGGDASAASAQFLAVAEEATSSVNSTEVVGVIWRADGTTTHLTLPMGIAFKRRPVLSKTCGDNAGGNAAWALVYRHEPYQTNVGQLHLAVIQHDGQMRSLGGIYNLAFGPVLSTNGNQWAVSSPVGPDGSQRFLCADTRVDVQTGHGAIYGHVFDRNGVFTQQDALLAGDNHDLRSPVVDSDGTRFVLAHTYAWSATDIDVKASTWALVGNQLVQQDASLATSTTDVERRPCLCAAIGTPNTYGLAWVHEAGGTFTLESRIYRGAAAAGVTARATNCGPLTTTMVGPHGLGETFTIGRSNASGVGGVLAGLPVSQAVGVCPACVQGVNGSTSFGTSFPVVVPRNPALVGATVAFQSFRFTAGGPCLGQVELGTTLDVTVQ